MPRRRTSSKPASRKKAVVKRAAATSTFLGVRGQTGARLRREFSRFDSVGRLLAEYDRAHPAGHPAR